MDPFKKKYLKYKSKYIFLKEKYIGLANKETNVSLDDKLKYIMLRKDLKNSKLHFIQSNSQELDLNKSKYINNQNGGGKTDLLLFKATWCGHCKHFIPVWEQLQKQFNSKFNFITYDSDKDKDKIEEWKINGFPTLIIRNGNNKEQYTGSRDLESMTALLNNMN